ncbi:MAG: FMN-binding negative transcriptional regulator [Alphaproteobacteria bacterium]|nr:FMN-binding negative transcriptional regulator [Alphaproteobacteria bacterium]
MYPNTLFRSADEKQNLAFAEARGFGMLTINGDEGLLAAHIPFCICDDGARIELHLARVNPILKQLSQPIECLLAVNGPDGYVSPDWYELDNNQVPTWNYVTVHIRGALKLLPPEDLPGVVERLSAQFEARLSPKPPWRASKMDANVYARMQRAIAPLEISVEAIDATWKLSQNKPEAARQRVSSALRNSTVGAQLSDLSRFVNEHSEAMSAETMNADGER